jgi:hypothetical protein
VIWGRCEVDYFCVRGGMVQITLKRLKKIAFTRIELRRQSWANTS